MRLPLLVATAQAITAPVDYVNLLAGSFTKGDVFSTGNTMPLVGRPWGFNHWALQTNDGQSSWWFNGNDHEFRWIRCTHQPSPWIGDYGWFFVGPQMGGFTTKPTGFFEPRSGRIKPHAMDFRTAPDGRRVELAPTMHGAALRVTFPGASRAEKRVCFKLGGGGGDSYKSAGGGAAEFRTHRNSGGAPNFNHHVFVEAVSGSPSFESHGHDTFCFGYPSSATTVEVRMCSSFISQEQARHTYDVELRRESSHERSFGDVRLESEDEWNALLSRAAVKNTHADASPPTSALEGKDLVVFYTGLYRALTFPRRIDEPSARGAEKRLHWSPYSKGGSVHDGTLVTDNGFWDTFRTVYPLLALVYPDHLGWIVDGWVNAYREGGWIPKWASPGYRNSMVGTYGDVVVAEAIVKGVGGFDEAAAWDALHKDAYEEAPQGGAVGKVGLRVYNQHGYIPADSGVSDCVSRTLDFAHADWATANAAEVLGHAEDAKRLRDRARGAVTHLYDKSTGLMRPKQKSGAFSSRFSPTRWGDGYTEGSAWHHSFPPFDVELLASLHGGKDGLVKQIMDMLDAPSTFEAGGYGQTIHEMREMRALAMGQYGHNNQPAHHILWLLALAGRSDLCNRYVRRVADPRHEQQRRRHQQEADREVRPHERLGRQRHHFDERAIRRQPLGRSQKAALQRGPEPVERLARDGYVVHVPRRHGLHGSRDRLLGRVERDEHVLHALQRHSLQRADRRLGRVERDEHVLHPLRRHLVQPAARRAVGHQHGEQGRHVRPRLPRLHRGQDQRRGGHPAQR